MSQLTVLPAADQAALESQLTRWKQAEEGLEHCAIYSRVMQGMVLAELRKLIQRPGSRTDLTSPKLSERLNWADYVKKGWGFSDDKARMLIQLGEAAKPRLRKLAENAQAGLGAILDKPLSQLSEPELASLKAVTHKLTDGKTNRMIQEELGLFKGDAAKKKGGNQRKAEDSAEASEADEAGAEETPATGLTAEQEATEHCELLIRSLDTLLAENWHTLLTADQRTQLAAALAETKRKVEAVK